jgi:nucleoid-associated protein YgaU
MGIFDFVKDAGSKIGLGESKAEKAAAATEAARDEELHELREANKILNLIIGMNQIEQPRVEFDDGTATVWGKAPDQKTKETTVLVVGNVHGVARVDDRIEVEEPAPESVFYTVKSGDTLGKIAKEHYGDASRYMKIFEANQPMLKDPNLIYPGQALRIPQED